MTDKNPGNPNANAEMALISNAAEVISKHRERAARNREGFDEDEYDEDDDEFYDEEDEELMRNQHLSELFARMFFSRSRFGFHFGVPNNGGNFHFQGGDPFASHPRGECNCFHCQEKIRRMKEKEEAEVRRKKEKEEQKQQRLRDLEAEQARMERLKEENIRIAAENKAREQAAILARQRQRESIGDTVTVLIDNLKSKLADAKASKGSALAIAELKQFVEEGKARLDEQCEDGSNLVSVKFGRDKLVTAHKKAVAYIKSIDTTPVPIASDCNSPTGDTSEKGNSEPISDSFSSPSSCFNSPTTTNSAANTPIAKFPEGRTASQESGRKLLNMLHRQPETVVDTAGCGNDSTTHSKSGNSTTAGGAVPAKNHSKTQSKFVGKGEKEAGSSNLHPQKEDRTSQPNRTKADNQKSTRGELQKPAQTKASRSQQASCITFPSLV